MFKIDRKPGDRWNIRGPVEYVPPVEVEVVMKRQAIPLDENEGIYVRDIKTGKVRQYYKNTLVQCIWPFSSCVVLIGSLRLLISRGILIEICWITSSKIVKKSFERTAFKLSTSD